MFGSGTWNMSYCILGGEEGRRRIADSRRSMLDVAGCQSDTAATVLETVGKCFIDYRSER